MRKDLLSSISSSISAFFLLSGRSEIIILQYNIYVATEIYNYPGSTVLATLFILIKRMGAYRNQRYKTDKSLGMVSDLEPYLTAMLTGALFGTENNVLFNCKILVQCRQ